MRWIFIIFLCLFLSSCSSVGKTLKYGYLPGGNYQYYSPLTPGDLHGKHYKIVITDRRDSTKISCAEFPIPRDTELEGATGYNFFTNYFRAMIEANNGIVDSNAKEIIEVELTALSAKLKGFGYVRAWGLVEFKTFAGGAKKTYCSAMADGDKGAPVGKYSFATRRGALRKMVSASTRRAIEQFMQDLASIQSQKI